MATENKLSPSEIIHYTNYWCRSKGISTKDLESHPQIEDVMLLLKFREGMWSKLNRSEQAHWGAYWNWCYHRKFLLKKKHLKKLELITEEATQRHLIKIIKQSKARQRIHELRQTV